jgi:hypothetical protein
LRQTLHSQSFTFQTGENKGIEQKRCDAEPAARAIVPRAQPPYPTRAIVAEANSICFFCQRWWKQKLLIWQQKFGWKAAILPSNLPSVIRNTPFSQRISNNLGDFVRKYQRLAELATGKYGKAAASPNHPRTSISEHHHGLTREASNPLPFSRDIARLSKTTSNAEKGQSPFNSGSY